MHIQPYLSFDGRCEEALEFYKTALDAEVVYLIRFKDSPGPPPPATEPSDWGNKVMHATFKVGETTLLATDGSCQGQPVFQGIALSVAADDDASAERMFAALGDGGQIQMPMSPTFFASRFGIVVDRFSVRWMVVVRT
jgi:PhnB protein